MAASDFVDQQSASWLRKYVVEKADNIAASVAIPEVKGVIDGGALSSLLEKKCGASVTKVDTDGKVIAQWINHKLLKPDRRLYLHRREGPESH